jgi:hypothetical protein
MNAAEPSAIDWSKVNARMTTCGANGKLQSALMGTESDEELRVLALKFTQYYQLDQRADHNPFRMMSGLTRESLHKLIGEMNRETILFLFESECEYRNRKQAGPAQNAAAKP